MSDCKHTFPQTTTYVLRGGLNQPLIRKDITCCERCGAVINKVEREVTRETAHLDYGDWRNK